MTVSVNDLPPPPDNKSGWPWNQGTDPLPKTRRNGKPWPRISIVTPSFNQGEFIEETIRSILLQGYPDFEYIIMDGGSTDQSLEVIERYQNWITYSQSGRDGGQTYAIIDGASRCTGQIFNWINSDDRLEPRALAIIGESWGETDMLSGATQAVTFGEKRMLRSGRLSVRNLIDVTTCDGFHQPSVWLDLNKFREIGLNHDRQYGFDWELMIRYLARWPRLVVREEVLSQLLIHETSKSGSLGFRFNKDRLHTALEFGEDPQYQIYLNEIRRRIYREWRAVACGSEDTRELLKFLLLNPRSFFDRFALGSIKRRVENMLLAVFGRIKE